MKHSFHPVLELPPGTPVLDLSQGPFPHSFPFSIGKYAERRPGVYTGHQYAGGRIWHVGIDLGAPEGSEIRSFGEGVVFDFADHAREGDYGPTLITRHDLEGKPLYALWGHLSKSSLEGMEKGKGIRRGEKIGEIGSSQENGGWPSHLHLQLSWEAPVGADLPGTVTEADLEIALRKYPDPRMVLGPLYADGRSL